MAGVAAGPAVGTASASVTTSFALPTVAATYSYSFSDVKPGDTFYGSIMWLASEGITTGYPDGTFRPKTHLTRGQMAAFMYRMAGSPAFSAPSKSPFSDLKPGDLFYQSITWLASEGITTGYADGTFGSKKEITRGQMAAFLYRYAARPTWYGWAPSFPDVRLGQSFYNDIQWMAALGITVGYPNGYFGKNDPVTRGQMAAFIDRFGRHAFDPDEARWALDWIVDEVAYADDWLDTSPGIAEIPLYGMVDDLEDVRDAGMPLRVAPSAYFGMITDLQALFEQAGDLVLIDGDIVAGAAKHAEGRALITSGLFGPLNAILGTSYNLTSWNYAPSYTLDPRFSTCGAAQSAGFGPYYDWEFEYRWYYDADHDGIVCE